MSSFTSNSDDNSDDIFYSFDEDNDDDDTTLVDEALEAQFNPGKTGVVDETPPSPAFTHLTSPNSSCPASPQISKDALELKSIDPLLLHLQKKMSSEDLTRTNTPSCDLGDELSTDEEDLPEFPETSKYIIETDEDRVSPSEKGKFKALFDKVKTKAEDIQTKVKSKAEEMQTMVKAMAVTNRKDKPGESIRSPPVGSPTKMRWFIANKALRTVSPTNSISTSLKKKSKREFGNIQCIQEVFEHEGAIWTMQISPDGQYVASGGRDCILRVWKTNPQLKSSSGFAEYLCTTPVREFEGHNGDILDVAWAKKTHLILSASMDYTVRLWAVDNDACLYVFQLTDIVTSVVFHPTDENLFLSGSLDNKLTLWSIETKKPLHTQDLKEFITTIAFTLDGKVAITGSHCGKCTFFDTNQLEQLGQIHVHSTRGKNKKGKKITGIKALPGNQFILVTSNDSRIRLYRLSDYSFCCKYKGLVNDNFQIKATVSAQGNYIICGSEDHGIYIWNTNNEFTLTSPADNLPLIGNIPIIGTGARRDISTTYECFAAHSKVVTVALFAPLPEDTSVEPLVTERRCIISADSAGLIRIFENQPLQPQPPPIVTSVSL